MAHTGQTKGFGMADLKRFFLATLSWWKALFLAFMLLSSAGVFAQATSQSFDHVKTGFTLKGMHANARCESCHVGGVFKGTPRDCATCHVSGSRLATSNVVRHSQHFVTQQTCDTCHSTVTFTGAKFDHLGVTSASCSSCHNGSTASGKPANHIKTDAACGTCHKTSGWIPSSGMDHSGMTAATN